MIHSLESHQYQTITQLLESDVDFTLVMLRTITLRLNEYQNIKKLIDIIKPDTSITVLEIYHLMANVLFFQLIAFFILLIEIFYHEFLRHLNWKLFLKMKTKKKITNSKVKIIQVKPVIKMFKLFSLFEKSIVCH